MRARIFLFFTVVFVFFNLNNNLFSIDVDGDLSDWGVTPGDDWIPDVESDYWVEDFVDYSNYGYVEPGYGGQPFDFEALYAKIEDNTLYVALVSGMPPFGANPIFSENGSPNTSQFQLPGDLAIDTTGDGFYDVGIELTGYSKNNPNGGSVSEITFDPLKKGNIYRMLSDEAWNKGLALSDYALTEIDYYQDQLLDYLDKTVVYYLQAQDPAHWVVETSVPLDILGTPEDTLITLHWTQTCGNDLGQVSIFNSSVVPPNPPVPEPSSLFLLISAVLGIGFRFSKKK